MRKHPKGLHLSPLLPELAQKALKLILRPFLVDPVLYEPNDYETVTAWFCQVFIWFQVCPLRLSMSIKTNDDGRTGMTLFPERSQSPP